MLHWLLLNEQHLGITCFQVSRNGLDAPFLPVGPFFVIFQYYFIFYGCKSTKMCLPTVGRVGLVSNPCTKHFPTPTPRNVLFTSCQLKTGHGEKQMGPPPCSEGRGRSPLPPPVWPHPRPLRAAERRASRRQTATSPARWSRNAS